MKENPLLLSVIVPAYNEEHTVGDIIKRLKTTIKNAQLKFEILVIDDRSRDQTVKVSLNEKVTVY